LAQNHLPRESTADIYRFHEVDIDSLVGDKSQGRGGRQGSVHEVTWNGDSAAAKIYLDTDIKAFERELKALGALNSSPHPNIVTLRGVQYKSPAILMEWCDDNIEFALQRQSFSYYQFLRFALDIARGMERMHSVKVTHGDLKASNILLSKTFGKDGEEVWTAKISDYGLAKLQGSSSYVPRSDTYLKAPEFSGLPQFADFQHEGAKMQTEESRLKVYQGADVFQAGWIYVEMLAMSTTTWRQKSVQELGKQDHELLEVVKCKSDKAARLILECWCKDPKRDLCGRPPFKKHCEILTEVASNTCSLDFEDLRKFKQRHETTKVYRVLDDLDLENWSKGRGYYLVPLTIGCSEMRSILLTATWRITSGMAQKVPPIRGAFPRRATKSGLCGMSKRPITWQLQGTSADEEKKRGCGIRLSRLICLLSKMRRLWMYLLGIFALRG
jgi:serine/threonine protein kinase